MKPGSLVVVGVGLKFVSHLTVEARAHIEQSQRVFLVLGDLAAMLYYEELNPKCTRLQLYKEPGPALDSAGDWQQQIDAAIELVLEPAVRGETVCLVLDGHPAVMVPPVHAALRLARERGLTAKLLPAISAEDCLFADLGIDPARDGCLSFEATDFLIRRRTPSITSGLILRQIGLIGEFMLMGRRNERGIRVLCEVLTDAYGPDHEVVIYQAASYPIGDALVQTLPLKGLPNAAITDYSSLYVPPSRRSPVDQAMLDRLGIPLSRVRC